MREITFWVLNYPFYLMGAQPHHHLKRVDETALPQKGNASKSLPDLSKFMIVLFGRTSSLELKNRILVFRFAAICIQGCRVRY